MLRYRCKEHNISTATSVCPVCGNRAELERSDIFWCDECRIPLYQKHCSMGHKVRRLTTDIRPVFPEERLLLEILLGEPFCFREDSVWNATGNKYIVNGKRIEFSIHQLKDVDADQVRHEYNALKEQNSDEAFLRYISRFVEENRERMDEITKEAVSYIRQAVSGVDLCDMFVSFSGGKDSTVTSDLVMRALSEPKVLHIFGDTTLEFPETMKYVERFRKEHPRTPVISSRNKEKDFESLCRLVGPPSRVMRWCCTIFKTGAINRKIRALFQNKSRIITFYGIRRSESASRSKYERETEGSKITKQITISPIIDWQDFDVWLYLLSTGIDFNYAYRLGYARVGCWCCPNNSVWSEFLSRIYMPTQYGQFHELLVEFAKSIGKKDAETYVADGKWKARQGGNGVAYAKNTVVSFQPCALEENAFNYELKRPLTEEFYQLFQPFGYLNYELGNKRLGEVYVTKRDGTLRLKIQGRPGADQVRITIYDYHLDGAASLHAAEDKIKCQLTKYQLCMGCRACEAVCRYNAINITEDKTGQIHYTINEEKCVRCMECVNHFNGGCYIRKVLATKNKE